MKKNGIYLSVIFILLIVIGIGGYSYYNYVKKVQQNSIKNSNETKENNENVENQEVKISDSEIKDYLNIIPLSLHVSNEEEKDPYIGEYITVDDISKSVLYSRVFKEMKRIENDIYLDCESYGSVKDFKDILKKYYNISNPVYQNEYGYESQGKEEYRFEYMGSSVVEYNNKLYKCDNSGADNINSKINKIVDYKILDNNLIITEKVGLVYKNIYENDTLLDILSTSNPNNKVTIVSDEEQALEYFNNNLDKFKTFKHTFKKSGSGYYYFSTELS